MLQGLFITESRFAAFRENTFCRETVGLLDYLLNRFDLYASISAVSP